MTTLNGNDKYNLPAKQLKTSDGFVNVSGGAGPLGAGESLISTSKNTARWQVLPDTTAKRLKTSDGFVDVSLGPSPSSAGETLVSTDENTAQWQPLTLAGISGTNITSDDLNLLAGLGNVFTGVAYTEKALTVDGEYGIRGLETVRSNRIYATQVNAKVLGGAQINELAIGQDQTQLVTIGKQFTPTQIHGPVTINGINGDPNNSYILPEYRPSEGYPQGYREFLFGNNDGETSWGRPQVSEISDISATAEELNTLAGIVPGYAAGEKALVPDSNVAIQNIDSLGTRQIYTTQINSKDFAGAQVNELAIGQDQTQLITIGKYEVPTWIHAPLIINGGIDGTYTLPNYRSSEGQDVDYREFLFGTSDGETKWGRPKVSEISDLSASAAEINILDGVTASTAEINILTGVTVSANDINVLQGVIPGTALPSRALVLNSEKNLFGAEEIRSAKLRADLVVADRVTIGETTTYTLPTYRGSVGQFLQSSGLSGNTVWGSPNLFTTDLVGVTASAAEVNILHGVTASTSEINILDGVTASADEINYLDGSIPGTVVAGKAVVSEANRNITNINTLISSAIQTDVLDASNTNLQIGSFITLDVHIGHVDCSSTIEGTATIDGSMKVLGPTILRQPVTIGTNNTVDYTLPATRGGVGQVLQQTTTPGVLAWNSNFTKMVEAKVVGNHTNVNASTVYHLDFGGIGVVGTNVANLLSGSLWTPTAGNYLLRFCSTVTALGDKEYFATVLTQRPAGDPIGITEIVFNRGTANGGGDLVTNHTMIPWTVPEPGGISYSFSLQATENSITVIGDSLAASGPRNTSISIFQVL